MKKAIVPALVLTFLILQVYNYFNLKEHVENTKACYFAKGVSAVKTVNLDGQVSIYDLKVGDYQACRAIGEELK